MTRAAAFLLIAACGGSNAAPSESWSGTFAGTTALSVDDPCFGGALVANGMLAATIHGDLLAVLRGDDQGEGVTSGDATWSCATTVQTASSAAGCQLTPGSIAGSATIEASTNAGIAITIAKGSVDPTVEVQAGSSVATVAPALHCAVSSLGASVIATCNDGIYLDGTLTLARLK